MRLFGRRKQAAVTAEPRQSGQPPGGARTTPRRRASGRRTACDSHDDLGLRFSDMGYLWAVVPTAELATGDFTHLLCDGESS
jgi:hypothetical protein